MSQLEILLKEIRSCTVCSESLPLGPRPILSASPLSKVLIVGQAPGTRVHKSGIPWDDPSGDRLRLWMGVDKEIFYDDGKIAIVPMGLCYPGKGKSGDLPPRKECADLYFDRLLPLLSNIKLTIIIGQYAQAYYLKNKRKNTLTETVKSWKEYLPNYIVLPHPSPRNFGWFKKNPWFDDEVLPTLRNRIREVGVLS
ncbi:MAG: uracil-DNA glycosylase family protein [Calditrichaeota bacterium]|nr:MAG: uracil-DNA glycosylase family protein [Calditrichota bacterium]MBL1205812.1 uracil-DNA glycosylase family protein [Calditrichota bacterium]NOG45640.1 uracil-DNA glycosylase family protein [Calditrichota bacterium]